MRLESAIKGITDLNTNYTTFVASYGGRDQQKTSSKDDSRAMILSVIAIISVIVAIAGLAAGIIANSN